MILVDSSVWIDYFRGTLTPQTNRLDELLGSTPLAVGDLIEVEVLQGFVQERDFAAAKLLLSDFERLPLGGFEVAAKAVDCYRELRRRGVTVRKTVDTIIAARCLVDDLPLLFSDRDFDPFVKHLGLRDAMRP